MAGSACVLHTIWRGGWHVYNWTHIAVLVCNCGDMWRRIFVDNVIKVGVKRYIEDVLARRLEAFFVDESLEVSTQIIQITTDEERREFVNSKAYLFPFFFLRSLACLMFNLCLLVANTESICP